MGKNGYTPPTEIDSPRQHWSLISVLMDGGAGAGALAVGRWDNLPVLAARWNGTANTIGSPQSRGIGTWFILPEPLVEPIIESLSTDKKTLVRNFIPKPKAKN